MNILQLSVINTLNKIFVLSIKKCVVFSLIFFKLKKV